MNDLTVREIAENIGVTTQAVRLWRLDNYTPKTVANKLRELSKSNFEKSARLNGIAQRQRDYANKIEGKGY